MRMRLTEPKPGEGRRETKENDDETLEKYNKGFHYDLQFRLLRGGGDRDVENIIIILKGYYYCLKKNIEGLE